MYQKSRIKWLTEGDLNYSFFFHSIVNHRRRKNNILALLSRGMLG